MIVARDAEGQGRLVHRGQGRLARQGRSRRVTSWSRAVAELERAVRARRAAVDAKPGPERAGRPSTSGPSRAPLGARCRARLQAGRQRRDARGVRHRARRARRADPRVVALDADVKNSTFSEKFEKAHPDRFYQTFIAEQVMVGAAMGLASRGAIPFPSTFACFPDARLRFHPHGRHLEPQREARRLACRRVDRRGRPLADGARGSRDDARRAELHGALSVRRRQRGAARRARRRTIRGRSTSARRGRRRRSSTRRGRRLPGRRLEGASSKPDDVATVVAAGVTVFEALKAHDELEARGHRRFASSTRTRCSRSTPRRSWPPARHEPATVVTVEDHYAHGGLGDAVSGSGRRAEGISVHRLAVREIPRSGKPEELLERFGISARAHRRGCPAGDGNRRHSILNDV